MTPRLFGRVNWLGYELSLAVPHATWFNWLEDFTGLDVETDALTDRTPVLTVVDDQHVLVDGHDERQFADLDALKAWLFLTVSDVMMMRGGALAFHAAGLVVNGSAVLISGPPWSGKSTWALEAVRRGIPVLGDDQVAVDATTGTVRAVPRPLKRRVVDKCPLRLSQNAVRAMLDGEDIMLEPRLTAGFASVEQAYPVSRIIHLARHAGPGVDRHVLSTTDAFRLVLDQLRGVPLFASVGAATRLLGRLPNIRLSVGDEEVGGALDVELAISRASAP